MPFADLPKAAFEVEATVPDGNLGNAALAWELDHAAVGPHSFNRIVPFAVWLAQDARPMASESQSDINSTKSRKISFDSMAADATLHRVCGPRGLPVHREPNALPTIGRDRNHTAISVFHGKNELDTTRMHLVTRPCINAGWQCEQKESGGENDAVRAACPPRW